jgi:hypothetical protein
VIACASRHCQGFRRTGSQIWIASWGLVAGAQLPLFLEHSDTTFFLELDHRLKKKQKAGD